MWDLPRSGIEPVSLTLAGGFFTTEPPRKSTLFLNTTSLSWRIKKNLLRQDVFKVWSSRPFERPSCFAYPGPFALPSLLPSLPAVLWSSFSLRQKTAQHPSLFFFFLAASGFGCSKGSLLQLVNFSLVVTPGLSCPSACGILVPQPGIEPASSALQGGFLTTRSPGKSQYRFPLEALGFSLRTTTPAQPIYLVDCLLPWGPAKSHPTVITEILPSKGPEVN